VSVIAEATTFDELEQAIRAEISQAQRNATAGFNAIGPTYKQLFDVELPVPPAPVAQPAAPKATNRKRKNGRRS
jgi:hypothetical protein